MVVGDAMVEAACRSWHSEKWWELARPDELRAARSGMARALEAALAVSGWEQRTVWRVTLENGLEFDYSSGENAFSAYCPPNDRVEQRTVLVGPWVRADAPRDADLEADFPEIASQDEPEGDGPWELVRRAERSLGQLSEQAHAGHEVASQIDAVRWLLTDAITVSDGPVPVQQDEPEGVCAFPNCSCTENRCPAKGERGPFCDHGFHPRLCGRCAPVPEAVTDEDEVQCQMCKTVQPRPDKECGHCGAGPKYLCPIHTRPAAAPVQQERSVRAPKTDDPHSLPRVDDLLDDIPVQQEPGRYSDRERVADYLASAQGVEFHDLNDDAQREWLMRASDALRAVWSIGRLVDADDGYEVMCEPVAAMVEDVRAALVPVQQDEPEAFTTYLPWGIVKLDDVRAWVAENHPGYRFTSNNLCVGEGGERQCVRLVPVQQEPELAARILDPDFADGFVAGARAERAAAVSSVGLRDRVRDEVWRREWPEFTGTAEEVESDRHDRLSSLVYGVLSVLHEAGTQVDGGLVHSLAVALVTATTEAQEGIKPSDEALRHRDALVQRARAAGEGQRQHREMFDTFAPTEPTIDDLQRSPAEAGTQEDGLDALARQFKNGQTVVWGDGPTQQGAVVGFGYTIPERPGGPDRPALVVRERWGERTGHVLPSELDAHAAVSGTPDTNA